MLYIHYTYRSYTYILPALFTKGYIAQVDKETAKLPIMPVMTFILDPYRSFKVTFFLITISFFCFDYLNSVEINPDKIFLIRSVKQI